MRCAIPNGGDYDGVRLIADATSPLPDGAISPVTNWAAIVNVPEYYLIVSDDDEGVREMTSDEKEIVDNDRLPSLKELRVKEVDAKTGEIISRGFEFDDIQFSLSASAQKNWLAMLVTSDKGILPFPIAVTTLQEQEYLINDEATLVPFVGKALYTINYQLGFGRQLKIAVLAAQNIEELNAVVDPRT